MSPTPEFYEDHGKIEEFANKTLLGKLADAGHKAQQYTLNNVHYNITNLPNSPAGTHSDGFGFMYTEAEKILSAVHYDLAKNYECLWSATEASGKELVAVAKYYRLTDEAVARRMDRHYGEGKD
ncbi:MAG TPA: hypothetical protein VFC19_00880 [Candidatus Limnocylindrales bacterium]|nr:hypothetical protein [Candidatus Limnocylindrales bacterium]